MPLIEDKTLYWLWYSRVFEAGSVVAERVLAHFGGSIEALYQAGREEYAEIPRLTRNALVRLCDKSLEEAREIRAYCVNEGVGILTLDSPMYPERLKRIATHPTVLYYKGILTNLDREVCIAEVGTRSMTEYGSRNAYSIAYDMAKAGAVVVSGLAKGADGMAHRGALDAGGYTVAVLGCGIDRAYPPENRALMNEIMKRGLVLTEYRPFSAPLGGHFPVRNRIISGLSLATVVVEAPARSGALITARTALTQGRDVFALPGKIGEMNAVGTNELLREGAHIVTDVADILCEYQPLYPGKINLNRISSIRSRKYPNPTERAAAPQPFASIGGRDAKEGEARAGEERREGDERLPFEYRGQECFKTALIRGRTRARFEKPAFPQARTGRG